MNSMSSQHCRPISTQSITSTDSADSEENYVAMVSPTAGGPAQGMRSLSERFTCLCAANPRVKPLLLPQ